MSYLTPSWDTGKIGKYNKIVIEQLKSGKRVGGKKMLKEFTVQ